MHCEWEDFDLGNGLWNITYKPDCQTKYGTGWSPKWNKARMVPLFPEALEVLQQQPRVSNFVFPKSELKVVGDEKLWVYSRVDNLSKSWKTLKRNAGVEDLQLKDLRTYFNWILINRYHFTHKEAGTYIGNSQEINEMHYTPIFLPAMQNRMNQMSLNEAFGIIPQNQIN